MELLGIVKGGVVDVVVVVFVTLVSVCNVVVFVACCANKCDKFAFDIPKPIAIPIPNPAIAPITNIIRSGPDPTRANASKNLVFMRLCSI